MKSRILILTLAVILASYQVSAQKIGGTRQATGREAGVSDNSSENLFKLAIDAIQTSLPMDMNNGMSIVKANYDIATNTFSEDVKMTQPMYDSFVESYSSMSIDDRIKPFVKSMVDMGLFDNFTCNINITYVSPRNQRTSVKATAAQVRNLTIALKSGMTDVEDYKTVFKREFSSMSFPKKMDALTTWTGAEVKGNNIYVYYEVPGLVINNARQDPALVDNIKQSMISSLASSYLSYKDQMLADNARLIFEYHAEGNYNNTFQLVITARELFNAL